MAMQQEKLTKTYDGWWSKFYDSFFTPLVASRQRRAIGQMKLKPGDRILDVGIGTGMTLMWYPRDVYVVGVDISIGMLEKAQQRKVENNLSNCHLIHADAMLPPFAQGSFDHALITHTVSVVPDPKKLMDWTKHVVKPGGRIVLSNHFRSTHPVFGRIERNVINPLCSAINWTHVMELEDLMKCADLELEYRCKTTALDFWQIVVMANRPARYRGHREAASHAPASQNHAASGKLVLDTAS